MTSNHKWRFFRAGGFDQVQLTSGADLMAIDELDQKLWVALACPVNGLEFDAKTLGLIDTDKDGRVRAPELIKAVKWAGGLLRNPDDLLKGAPSLPLNAISDSSDEGKAVLSSARQLLANLGKRDATSVSIDDTTDTAKIFAQTAFNGDGIIVAESAGDDATRAVIADIIATQGSVTDRSGKPGIDQTKLDAFFAEAAAFDTWVRKSEAEANTILPLGDSMAAAVAALKAIRAKVDDYFGRCRLAAFDQRALNALNREEKEYLALAAKDLTITAQEVQGFPLATVAAGKPLPLKVGVNPAWAAPVAALQSAVIKPLLGDRLELTEADWAAVCGKLAPYEAWIASKTGGGVEKLGIQRVREVLSGKAKDSLSGLLARDKAEEGNANAIAAVDRLVRYHRDLYLLCINFVSFKDFYDSGDPAIFQAGTLYLDQRSCTLCLTVEDAAKHATMAGLAGTYLAYCDCARKGSSEKLSIVAAFTDGDSDNLMVGRNGIFYDRKGRDWDATITRIIDNPISIRQAFWSPYKKVVRFIEEQIAKRAAASDAAANEKLIKAAAAAADPKKPDPAVPPPPPKKMDVGVVAALGVAFGAIGAALSGLATGLMKLPIWQIPLVFVGLMLLISGPAMIIAWLKLRKRNLGPILDANGWAVNARARVNVPFGKSLTGIATLPPGSTRDLSDPFAEKPSPWPKIIIALVVLWILFAILNRMGFIFDWTNGRLGTQKPRVEQAGGSTPGVLAPSATDPAR